MSDNNDSKTTGELFAEWAEHQLNPNQAPPPADDARVTGTLPHIEHDPLAAFFFPNI